MPHSALRGALHIVAAIMLAALALLVPGGPVPSSMANPAQIWLINLNVAAAVRGSAMSCTPAGADAAAADLDAIATASAGQVSADQPYAGGACLIVKTDGSATSVTVNGRGLVCTPACDGVTQIAPLSGSSGTFAVTNVTAPGTFTSGNVVTAVQDAVAIDSAALTVVGQAHDIALTPGKTTIQEGAASCALTSDGTLPAIGIAKTVYTDINGTPLVGYSPTIASSNVGVMKVGNVTGSGAASQPVVTMMLADTTIAGVDAYCGESTGVATLSASSESGAISGVAGKVTRTATITVTGVPAAIALSATPAAIPCDGASTSTVTATITDSASNPVVDGTPVSFNVVALGTANPVNTTTAGGVASSVITPLSGVTTGVVVTVTSGSASAQIQIVCAAPGPDEIAGAILIGSIPYSNQLDTTGFTTEPGEPLPCGNMGATAWYVLSLPLGNVALTADTAGSAINTALAVYTEPPMSPPGGLTLVGCNANGTASSVAFFVSSPGTYWIQAGGHGGATGSLTLNVRCTGDADCDGLSDADEATLGTNPYVPDTDGDGLSDGLEVHTYHTNPLVADTDADGCGDGKELRFVPPLDPTDPWDFYSVPVPALLAAPDPTTDFRDNLIGASDAQAVFAYFKAGAKSGTTAYDQDLNGNGINDGLEYDRSAVGPAQSGPPDGVVGASDAQLAFGQFKVGRIC